MAFDAQKVPEGVGRWQTLLDLPRPAADAAAEAPPAATDEEAITLFFNMQPDRYEQGRSQNRGGIASTADISPPPIKGFKGSLRFR